MQVSARDGMLHSSPEDHWSSPSGVTFLLLEIVNIFKVIIAIIFVIIKILFRGRSYYLTYFKFLGYTCRLGVCNC
jgi:hypothetical protein